MSKERGILFSAPMVRAILEGRKTQTRRVVKNQVRRDGYTCPYGKPGDVLWVRETWCGDRFNGVGYRATDAQSGPWKPSIFMPRWASRITLEITDVQVERVHDINECDIVAEGIPFPTDRYVSYEELLAAFRDLWDSINGKTYPWASNPWVWALTFKVMT
jgi:hypothetical protein